MYLSSTIQQISAIMSLTVSKRINIIQADLHVYIFTWDTSSKLVTGLVKINRPKVSVNRKIFIIVYNDLLFYHLYYCTVAWISALLQCNTLCKGTVILLCSQEKADVQVP